MKKERPTFYKVVCPIGDKLYSANTVFTPKSDFSELYQVGKITKPTKIKNSWLFIFRSLEAAKRFANGGAAWGSIIYSCHCGIRRKPPKQLSFDNTQNRATFYPTYWNSIINKKRLPAKIPLIPTPEDTLMTKSVCLIEEVPR